MNPEVQNVAPAPVSLAGKISYLRLISGRGERIRTSGPCLPKTFTLPTHSASPWVSPTRACHMVAWFPVSFTVQGSSRAFDPCLTA